MRILLNLVILYILCNNILATFINTSPALYNLLGTPTLRSGCPLCDASVYSYCTNKRLHDACCCSNRPYGGGGGLYGQQFGQQIGPGGVGQFGGQYGPLGGSVGPLGGSVGPLGGSLGPQVGGFGSSCQYENCRFLYANTCYEYNLIVSCCCNNPY